MTTKAKSTKVEEPTTAVATVRVLSETQAALATIDGADEKDYRGKENIESTDVILPFLAIVQKTSPQIEPDNEKYIEGAKFLDIFNSLTGEVYEQPVTFIPIVLRKHAIEFHPFDDGGGVKDRNVPWDDDRCEFHGDDKPLATRFYDWACLLVPSMELVVISFKSTNIGVAKQFQQILNMRKGAAFAGQYRIKTVSAESNGKKYGKFGIVPAGKPTDENYAFAETLFEGLKGKVIVTDHTADADEVVQGSTVPAGTEPAVGVTRDKDGNEIPF